jgi:hypothetical protein
MPVMKVTRTLRKAPNGEPTGVQAVAGTKVTVGQKQSGWTNVTLLDQASAPNGWVSTASVDETADVLGPLDKTIFALECHRQALIFGTSAHYLMAVATLRTNVDDGVSALGKGPYAFSDKEWTLNGKQPLFSLDAVAADIGSWRLQIAVFAIMARLMQQKLAALLGASPTATQLYLAQFLGSTAAAAAIKADGTKVADILAALDQTAAEADGIDVVDIDKRHGAILGTGSVKDGLAAISAALKTALDVSKTFIQTAGDQLLASTTEAIVATGTITGRINFDSPKIVQSRRNMAELIALRFQEAGYGMLQQIAAIANAIAESSLKADARGDNGNSWGLFQLNQAGGVGAGFSSTILKDPDRNITIMLTHIATLGAANARFKATASAHDAVDVFVRQFERPAHQDAEVAKRTGIAETLLG